MQYHEYAAVYDRSGQLRFSVLMDLYLQDVLRAHSLAGRAMLDLACGTGTLALLMAERGWDVLGLDRSTAMLEQARRKAVNGEQAEVRFIEGDMRDFTLPAPVDLATCCYDTLNYLTDPPDLQRCFGSVARAVVPGGLFCFDLATDFFLQNYWQGVEVDQFGGVTQIMQSHYDPRSGYSTLVLTGFVPSGRGRYRRFREVHIERAYPQEEVAALLQAAGFAVEAIYDCFTLQQPHARSLRELYVARRVADRG